MRVLAFLTLSLVAAFLGQSVSAKTTLPPELSQYLKEQGPIAKRGLLSSTEGEAQLLLYYCVDQNAAGGRNEGALNSKNFYCEIALFLSKNPGWALAGREELGHGVVLAFSKSIVTATSVTYAPEDALCCPSKRRIVKFSTNEGRLVALR